MEHTDSLANAGHDRKDRFMAERDRTAVLDSVAKSIIEQLQYDGRRSYASIAKDVGLSEAAVRQRVQRLIETGVVQIVAVTDPLQLGFEREAMIGIKVQGDVNAVADALAEVPEVDYVVLTAGSFDLIIEVVCENDAHLLDLLSSRIRNIDGVTGTETFVYLKLRKQLYNWGTR
jgi:Lrp/AsnC family transcriptional regulator for asnA, asnC and gidA